MNVLGIVAVLGRPPVVNARLGAHTLVERAQLLLENTCGSVVVVRDVDDGIITGLLESIGAADVVVVHDPLCPLVPVSFVTGLLEQVAAGRALVSVRPVVETIKATRGDDIVATVDRDGLRQVCSPVVAYSADLLAVDDLAAVLADPTTLAVELHRRGAELVPAPSVASRVEDPADLELLFSPPGGRAPAVAPPGEGPPRT